MNASPSSGPERRSLPATAQEFSELTAGQPLDRSTHLTTNTLLFDEQSPLNLSLGTSTVGEIREFILNAIGLVAARRDRTDETMVMHSDPSLIENSNSPINQVELAEVCVAAALNHLCRSYESFVIESVDRRAQSELRRSYAEITTIVDELIRCLRVFDIDKGILLSPGELGDRTRAR